MNIKIAPSILSADFVRLADEVEEIKHQEAIDKDSYDGRLFSARKDVHHPVQIGTTTWANPKFKFKSEYISPVKTGDYTVQICDSLWLNRSFRKVIEEKIAEAPLKQKRYVSPGPEAPRFLSSRRSQASSLPARRRFSRMSFPSFMMMTG